MTTINTQPAIINEQKEALLNVFINQYRENQESLFFKRESKLFASIGLGATLVGGISYFIYLFTDIIKSAIRENDKITIGGVSVLIVV